MKKLLFLLAFPLFIACSDDDNKIDPELIGKWSIKPGDFSSIDTLEFTQDFQFRESAYNTSERKSEWREWKAYSTNGGNFIVNSKSYAYSISKGNGTTILRCSYGVRIDGAIGNFTKVE